MTPEQAEDIFYETYRAGQWDKVGEPLIQQDLRKACWQAVINAISEETRRELDAEYAIKLLEQMDAPYSVFPQD